ncbi:MAG: hypothetical protein LBV61_03390 [Burkholderiaceae bacterium]|jgi:hypothetical protein|nr:hypothetical protein [Burkholderiaceae bacterium]
MMRFILHLLFGLAALVFALSLAVATLVLALLWGLYWLWARMTGRSPLKPITAWVQRADPLAGFARVRRAGDSVRWADKASAAAEVNARARGQSTDSPVNFDTPADISDATVRPGSRDGA